MQSLRAYYNLSKPGIVKSNAFSAFAGALFVYNGIATLTTALWCALGFVFVLAASCAANNVLERKSDAKMERTKKRELPSGKLSLRQAVIFVCLMLTLGLAILLLTLRPIVAVLALVLFISYVFVYTPSKRKTILSTWIGTIPGVVSIVGGYAAVTGTVATLDALLLVVVMAMWQVPHFYSIAIFRRDDYRAAGLPVHPNVLGMRRTIRAIRLLSVVFLLSCVLLSLVGSASWVFAIIMTVAAAYWVYLCTQPAAPALPWAKKQFVASLMVLMVFCAALIADGLLRFYVLK